NSTSSTPALLSVWSDGTLAGQEQVTLTPGTTSYSVDAVAGEPGLHTLTARVTAPGDTTPQNDELASPVVVGPPAHTLVVAADPGEAAALVAILRGQGIRATVVGPAAMPGSGRALHAYDAIVLDDVAATSLRAAQVQALHAAVYDDGRGLVVVGG